MTPFPYRLTGPIGSRATLGLIVLQADETIEQDMRRLFPGTDVALHVSRIPSGALLTGDALSGMEAAVPRAVSLLPAAARFDAIGFGCTSGTAVLGVDRLADLIRANAATAAVADPLSASVAAFRALGIRSVAIVSPYVAPVAETLCRAFRDAGLDVPASVSFGEEVEARVARIDPLSIRAAAMEVGAAAGVEAVFLSCTNLRTLDVIDDLERALGLPVVSSNQALAWQMSGTADAPLAQRAPGRLLRM